MALKRSEVTPAVAPTATSVATEEVAVETQPVETTATESNGQENGSTSTPKDRMPWTAEKVRAVKAHVRENPGIAFEDLLTQLRDGFLADQLAGVQGKQRLLNLLKGIRNAEEKAQKEGIEFIPLPDVVMPQSMARPNLLEG